MVASRGRGPRVTLADQSWGHASLSVITAGYGCHFLSADNPPVTRAGSYLRDPSLVTSGVQRAQQGWQCGATRGGLTHLRALRVRPVRDEEPHLKRFRVDRSEHGVGERRPADGRAAVAARVCRGLQQRSERSERASGEVSERGGAWHVARGMGYCGALTRGMCRGLPVESPSPRGTRIWSRL